MREIVVNHRPFSGFQTQQP